MTKIECLPEPSMTFKAVADFTFGQTAQSIPVEVLKTAKLLVLDLIGVAAAASKMDAAKIARNHAVKHWAAGEGAPSARLLFDGRKASLSGAAFAMATQIDNLDAHDGWQPSKGHAGAALLPALCAFAEGAEKVSGREALACMVVGYEVGYRAAVALHATVEDYHTSGAWNSLGCAAMGARLRNLSEQQYRDALGISEYHGPRSQMMREIVNPSMLHDGTGLGAPLGVYATLIAEDGFSGGPAATVEFQDAAFAWEDLGTEWLTAKQYIKPYPICRWAHAPIDAALQLRAKHGLTPDQIDGVEIQTFTYSAELRAGVPTTSPNAQYSLPWPVAAALVRGRVGVDEVLEESFSDPDLIAMVNRISVSIDPEIDTTFPEQRLARVLITLKDGTVLNSGVTEASGGPDPQPTEEEVVAKFRAFAGTVLDADKVAEIESAVFALDEADADFKELLDLLTIPITS